MALAARRARALGGRIRSFLSARRWILLSTVLALVGVTSVWVDIPAVVNLSLALLSLGLIVPEVVEFDRGRNATQFQDRGADDFSDVRTWATERPRFAVFTQRTGTFVIDKDLGEAIAADAVVFEVDPQRYEIPQEIREPGRLFLERRIANRLDVFDGPTLGLDSNVGFGETAVPQRLVLRRAKYFDHLATDLFAAHDVYSDRRRRNDLGRPLVIDRRGAPRDFGDSWVLNALGTSVVALTTDGWLVNVHQTGKNESSTDLLAPAGSGSLEPADVVEGDSSFRDCVVRGALREMAQEAGIGEADVADTAVLGFARWLDKGGKPEVLSVARLRIDSHEARRRRRVADDRPYSKFAEPCRILLEPERWDPDNVGSMVGREQAVALSAPLQVCLRLMARAIHAAPTPAGRLLREAMTGWRP